MSLTSASWRQRGLAMGQERVQQRATRVRTLVSLGMWLVAAGAAVVVGLDPDGLIRS